MKNLNLKSFLPGLLMLIAITSAFAFQKSNEKPSVLAETGWVDHPAPCTQPVECENLGGPICTVMLNNTEYDVKGKFNPSDITCERVLTRSN